MQCNSSSVLHCIIIIIVIIDCSFARDEWSKDRQEEINQLKRMNHHAIRQRTTSSWKLLFFSFELVDRVNCLSQDSIDVIRFLLFIESRQRLMSILRLSLKCQEDH